MSITRRQFLGGLAGILAASQAPAFVKAANLMPVKQLDSGLYYPDYLALWDSSGQIIKKIGIDRGTSGGSLVYDLVEKTVEFNRPKTIVYTDGSGMLIFS